MSYELIGYVASVLVAISLTMSSILRLRLINLGGAILFALYGYLIGSMPVTAVNLFIVGVNIFYLVRMFRTREYFSLLEVRHDSPYLRHFLDLNRADIARHLPDFREAPRPGELVVFILRDVVPAGVLVGEAAPDGTLAVRLDYVLPGYRDFKVGDFLYGHRAAFFRDRGISRLLARAGTRHHARYLRRMGFARQPGPDADLYARDVRGGDSPSQ
jgi:GNAT superfamily N-acetyltransferase